MKIQCVHAFERARVDGAFMLRRDYYGYVLGIMLTINGRLIAK